MANQIKHRRTYDLNVYGFNELTQFMNEAEDVTPPKITTYRNVIVAWHGEADYEAAVFGIIDNMLEYARQRLVAIDTYVSNDRSYFALRMLWNGSIPNAYKEDEVIPWPGKDYGEDSDEAIGDDGWRITKSANLPDRSRA